MVNLFNNMLGAKHGSMMKQSGGLVSGVKATEGEGGRVAECS